METVSANSIQVSTCTAKFYFTPQEIIRCEASSNYTWFHLTSGRKLLVAKTLGKYESLLSAHNFLRIHHTDIVNRQYIAKLEKAGVLHLTDGTCLTISRRRRSVVQKMLAVA